MRILEVDYIARVKWAHPIRRAIENNPDLAERDEAWKSSQLSDLAFAIETRLMYLPRILNFVLDGIAELKTELSPGAVAFHLSQGAAIPLRSEKAFNNVLFGTAAFITESRACFENLAAFYRQFLDNYCGEKISMEQGYDAVAKSTEQDVWANALRRIRHDLLHARSLFLAFDVDSPGWAPLFSMNWRPGHFDSNDRIEMRTLGEIWSGIYKAQSMMQSKIASIAAERRRG